MPDPEQPHTLWLTLRQNAFTVNTYVSSRPSLLYTCQCLRKESFCVLGLFYVLCCTPLNPPQMHTYTLLLLSPWIFSSVTLFFFFVQPGKTRTYAERHLTPDPPATLRHRMPVWSLSESFMCSFYLYGQSCFSSFRTSPVQNSAQLFPPQLIWNRNRHTVSLRSMEYVAILSRLSSDFGKKKQKTTKKD